MPASPEQIAARRLDGVAVRAVLRRLARAPEPPWLHGEIGRRMGEKLAIVLWRPERVIDWWSTFGAGAGLLAAAYPTARHLRVEPDEVWAQRSRARAQKPWWSAARWSGAAVTVATEADKIDPGVGLIWANMMLHAVVDPVALIERWHELLQVNGFVMFSCLGPGTLRELRAVYSRLGWPAPTPGFVDMHDLGDMLVHAGFADPVMDQETLTLRWRSAKALLAELRTLGGNTAPDRAQGLCTPRWRELLLRELQTLAAPDGSIGLSFEVAYGHAFKAAPRFRTLEPTVVSLDDMRTMVRAGRT